MYYILLLANVCILFVECRSGLARTRLHAELASRCPPSLPNECTTRAESIINAQSSPIDNVNKYNVNKHCKKLRTVRASRAAVYRIAPSFFFALRCVYNRHLPRFPFPFANLRKILFSRKHSFFCTLRRLKSKNL